LLGPEASERTTISSIQACFRSTSCWTLPASAFYLDRRCDFSVSFPGQPRIRETRTSRSLPVCDAVVKLTDLPIEYALRLDTLKGTLKPAPRAVALCVAYASNRLHGHRATRADVSAIRR
jgi:hypothetical protein